MSFPDAAALQERLRREILAGERSDTLLLLEHDPVITLGRSADPAHVLLPRAELQRRGVAVAEASRGGDVTYHGPGQLIGYPVFRLRRGVVAHVEAMAAGIVEVLASEGIRADWRRDCPGVWVGAEKVCAFGVHVRRRVAVHGFALNVASDLDAFAAIVPCGLRTRGVTSIERLSGRAPALIDLAARVAAAFARSFGVTLEAETAMTAFCPVASTAPIARMKTA